MANLLCGVTVVSKYDAADMAAVHFMVLNRTLIVSAPSAGSCWYHRSSFHSDTLGSDICKMESDAYPPSHLS